MKLKLLLTASVVAVFTLPSLAQTPAEDASEQQENTEQPVLKHCYTDEMDQVLIQEHPEVLQQRLQLEQLIQQWISDHEGGKNGGM